MDGLQHRNSEFDEIIAMIDKTRRGVFKLVNFELIDLYWNIGAYVSQKIKDGGWGKSVIEEFSDYLQRNYHQLKGFSPQNIWRMKQFYETYRDNPKLSPLVREISWSNNLLIMSSAKTDEAREFYIRKSIADFYSKRELERQLETMLFERTMISDKRNQQILPSEKLSSLASLRDNYVLEFLDIPDEYKEKDLRRSIISNLKKFILEFGRNFSFIGEEYRVQVGNTDFFIDLLFYNRELSCLVAIELKVGKFKPEHIGQLNFYLEALDRDIKKTHENPSVGLILCASKDDAVVEYALNRSLSPALVSEYALRLPDKEFLQQKLRELTEIAETT